MGKLNPEGHEMTQIKSTADDKGMENQPTGPAPHEIF